MLLDDACAMIESDTKLNCLKIAMIQERVLLTTIFVTLSTLSSAKDISSLFFPLKDEGMGCA